MITAQEKERKESMLLQPPDEKKMLRKPSMIEFTAYSSSLKSKKDISATKKSSKKSSRKSSDHMENIPEFGNQFNDKNEDEILETFKDDGNKNLRRHSSFKKKTLKKLFEEFWVIGIDKIDFQKMESNNQTKGYLTPKIMFEYPSIQESNENYMFFVFYY